MSRWRSRWRIGPAMRLLSFGSTLSWLAAAQLQHALQGDIGLISALGKIAKKEPNTLIAPVLFVAGSDRSSQGVASDLFELVVQPLRQNQVTAIPFGEDESDQRRTLALMTSIDAEETITSGAFASVGRETGLSFSFSSEIVYAIHVTDIVRGELHFALLQNALEQYLQFQDRVLIADDVPPKNLHVIVYGVDEKEAEELEFRRIISEQLDASWERMIKPRKVVEKEAQADNERSPFWTSILRLKCTFLPPCAYAPNKYNSGIEVIRQTLQQSLLADGPFMNVKTLAAAVGTLRSVSNELLKGAQDVPRDDTIICTFYLEKLMAKYVAQFSGDASRLLAEMSIGYAEDFGKLFTELIDKYMADFHTGIYGADTGTHISLQGLKSRSVATVVREKKQELRTALLNRAEIGYRQQLQFLRAMAQEEFRKTISTIKYQWELIPGFQKASKAARSLFTERANKVQVRGAKWAYANELRALTSLLEDQATTAIERSRAAGAFIPKRLRRPVGIQVNWLGSNFFHFIRDSSCDPLSIRTDAGVALWQSMGEVWASKKGRERRVPDDRLERRYGSDIDPLVMDYLQSNPKGIGVKGRDPRSRLGWNKYLAYDLLRNHDDMTFQIPNAKGIAKY